MSRRMFAFQLMIGAMCLFCWQASQGAKPKDEMLELYGLFVDAVEKVEANYVRPVNRRELLESALEGMLQNLDQHSSYINMGEWKQFRKQIEGKFGGIGIQVGVDPETSRLRVIAPMVGTPAYEAGVLAGDQIMEIDGQTTEGMSPDKAVEVLTGRPGTEVTLTLLHEGIEQTQTVKITRAIIDVPSVLGDRREKDGSWDYLIDKDRKIGYIRISSFIQNTAQELRKALEELKEKGARGLILDLRDNPGGLLSAAVEVSDLFLEKGEIVSTKGRNTIPRTYAAQKEGPFEDLPMAVLVNQNSASASEIVSAALQDHKRAAIVGQRSYGKGSVQNILELEDGNSVLKLTVASYFRPSGENIHRFRNTKASDKWGVSPDSGLEVKLSPNEYVAWFLGRRNRDLPEIGKAKKADDAPKPDEPKAKPDDAPKPDESKAKPDDAKAKPEGNDGKDGAATKAADPKKPAATVRAIPERNANSPFVDKALDKALEVIRGKLAAEEKSKAA